MSRNTATIDFSGSRISSWDELRLKEPVPGSAKRKTLTKQHDRSANTVSAINLSHNQLTDWEGFTEAIQACVFKPTHLTTVDISSNRLPSISRQLASFTHIISLNLSNNAIEDVSEVSSLASLSMLAHLYLAGNPMCAALGGDYRRRVAAALPKLRTLDRVQITPMERRREARPARPVSAGPRRVDHGQSRPTSAKRTVRPTTTIRPTPVRTRPLSAVASRRPVGPVSTHKSGPTPSGPVRAEPVPRRVAPATASRRTPTLHDAVKETPQERPRSTQARRRAPMSVRPATPERTTRDAPAVTEAEILEATLLQATVAEDRLSAFIGTDQGMQAQLEMAYGELVASLAEKATAEAAKDRAQQTQIMAELAVPLLEDLAGDMTVEARIASIGRVAAAVEVVGRETGHCTGRYTADELEAAVRELPETTGLCDICDSVESAVNLCEDRRGVLDGLEGGMKELRGLREGLVDVLSLMLDSAEFG